MYWRVAGKTWMFNFAIEQFQTFKIEKKNPRTKTSGGGSSGWEPTQGFI